MKLFRPVDIHELQLVYESGMAGFPPRLPGQPIFYPVLNAGYAGEIAERWNAMGPSKSGYITEFDVRDDYVSTFEVHQVGARQHLELWVPAAELPRFNAHIRAPIQVVGAYFGISFPGFIPTRFGLRGKNAVEQFVALARSLEKSSMDVSLEVKANHAAVFLNYAFWSQCPFESEGIDDGQKQKTLSFVKRVWGEAFPEISLPQALLA